jgi:3',5'-cyclic AMP phosphodiesterase CpdA
MSLKRREFFRLGGTGLLLAGLGPDRIFTFPQETISTASPYYEQLASDEFPFPYDDKVFEAAERVYNLRRSASDPSTWLAGLNLLLKSGKTLDIKVLVADRREDLANPRETWSYSGVQGSFDCQIRGYDSPRLYYQVQYREGQGNWRALPPRNFKLPNAKLQDGGQIQALFIADDHNFDDADYGVPNEYKQTKISGDFFYDFYKNLKTNPRWEPDWPLSKFKFSFCLAKALRHILASEDPDFFVNLGDSNGIGANYRWENWGLPFKNLTEQDYDYIAKTLWLRSRKAFSAVTPNMPVFWTLGNHDGDESWNGARFRAKYWRQKLFTFPSQTTHPEGGHPDGNYYAFSWGADQDNRGGAQFIMLDVTGFCGNVPKKVEEWTLGAEQLRWFEDVLSKNDHELSFACFHHVLGGWPAGSTEEEKSYSYGRGPLFTVNDYAGYADPNKVEQVKLTDLGKRYGLRGFIFGHDHIFKVQKIGDGANRKELHGIVCGATKYIGETPWWQGTYWKKHYGNGLKSNPDFWGPSGITRLTIKSDQTKVDYICTARTPYTNIPSGGIEGTVYSSCVMSSPVPSMDVDKTSFVFQMTDDNAGFPPQILKIRNGGGRSLNYAVKSKPAWLNVTPGQASVWGLWRDVSLSLSAEKFEIGYYEGAVALECPEASNNPLNIQVKLNPDPFIMVDKKSFVFQMKDENVNLPAQNLRIRNGGGRALNFMIRSKPDWIQVSPDHMSVGGAWRDISVSLSAGHLDIGSYEGAIVLECPEASNNPLNIQVTLNPDPFILVDKNSFTIELDERSSLPPPCSNLKIRNGGGRDLNYMIKPGQDWIKVSPECGNSRGAWTDVVLTVSAGNLAPGIYDGTISIESAEAVNNPLRIGVRMVIKEAPLFAPLNFAGTRMGAAFSTSREDTIILTWQENSLNSNVQKYRLYLCKDGGNRTLLGETDSRTLTYIYRQARKDKSYRFAVTAVNSRNREGEAAITTVEKSV